MLSPKRRKLLLTLVIIGQSTCFSGEQQVHSQPQKPLPGNARVSAVWQGQTLDMVLNRLTEMQGIEFWVDRRVNKQKKVESRLQNETLNDALDHLTQKTNLGWSALGNIYYVGPPEAAQEIATLVRIARARVSEMPVIETNLWLQEKRRNWPRLSQPRSLLTEWLQEQGIQLVNPQLISHDLWAARETPPLPLIDQVVLLLAGFNLTCEISPNRKCIVVPIERPVVMTRTYEAGPQALSAISRMSQRAPEFRILKQGKLLQGTGRWEDHQSFSDLLSGRESSEELSPVSRGGRRNQRFSLKLENQPFGKVISAIAAQAQLKVVWDEGLLDSSHDPRQRLVSCEVIQVDLPTLLQQIVEPVGVEFRLENDSLQLLGHEE